MTGNGSSFVADLGNSRLKWGRLDERGEIVQTVALPVDDSSAWAAAWESFGAEVLAGSPWAVASVNPPVARVLAEFLQNREVGPIGWYRSAADVPVRHALQNPETAGADRALAVVGALASQPVGQGRAGLVVNCGTAVTVERIAADGTWQGGAIAAGLGLSARALHMLTAQLPLVVPREAPPAWGSATLPALEAGIYWGVVGAIRELLARQSEGLDPMPWAVWTGGDASTLASAGWEGARVVPDLVLVGLAAVAFQVTGD